MEPLQQGEQQPAVPLAPRAKNYLTKCTESEQQTQPTCRPSMMQLVNDQFQLAIEQEILGAPLIPLLVNG